MDETDYLTLRAIWAQQDCTDKDVQCRYNEPHRHGGFDCDPSCWCQVKDGSK